jgi:hypothetical protein
MKCHNPDKLKGDLDLSSFGTAMKGGGSGVDLTPGDPEGSQLYRSITHADEPTMPPNKKLGDHDIAIIRAWIEGGLLQGTHSKALTANKPAVDLALKKVSVGRPDGPPPMPGALALEPVVHGARGSALGGIASSPWAPVVALAAAKQLVFYHTSDLEFLGVLPFPNGFPCDVKFSRDGKLLLASGGRGGQSGSVVVWNITTGERVVSIDDQFDSVLAADISPDRQWIALGGPDRVLKIYRAQDAALEHRIKKHTDWVTAVEFSPDNKYLASADRTGGVALWEAGSGHELFTLVGHKAAITAIAWRADSEMLLSASEDGTVKLWKASDGTAVRSFNAHPGGVLAARFSPEGRIVSCGRDNKVQIWETTGKNVRALPFAGDLPTRVSFNDDGKRVIASDWKGRVFVWDAATGKSLAELDANPPPLAERVAECTQRRATLRAKIEKATAAHVAAEAEAKAAQQNLEAVKKRTTPALEKQLAAATQRVAAAAKKVAAAKAALSELRAQLASAEAALTKWTAALHDSRDRESTSESRKISRR